jgi:hypothetical protein
MIDQPNPVDAFIEAVMWEVDLLPLPLVPLDFLDARVDYRRPRRVSRCTARP